MFPLYSTTLFELFDFLSEGVLDATSILCRRKFPRYNQCRAMRDGESSFVPEQHTSVEFKVTHVKRFYELFEKAVPIPTKHSECIYTRVLREAFMYTLTLREAFMYTLTLNHVIRCTDTCTLTSVTCPKLMDVNVGFER